MELSYISTFSGIEAATVAWHPLGFKPLAFSENEPFASAVLAHHYPDIPNLGDVQKVDWDGYRKKADIVVGGSPCQSFSVAGLRGGLDDPRGNLALEFFRVVDRVRPRWVVWENVPRVMSTNGGRDFGAILGALAKLGYGFAYRVLDAQYFGLPQRRQRIFVVGSSRNWRSAAGVLFDQESLSRNPNMRREDWEGLRTESTTRAFNWQSRGDMRGADTATTTSALTKRQIPAVIVNGKARKMTPEECESLQGFDKGYTLVPYRGKLAKKTPRYRAIGNSMAVPVMSWIGSRIKKVTELTKE